ncbi:MAG TPA: hypothetical protein VIO37_02360 [Candidatus Dormibacteraeota bacterium]
MTTVLMPAILLSATFSTEDLGRFLVEFELKHAVFDRPISSPP